MAVAWSDLVYKKIAGIGALVAISCSSQPKPPEGAVADRMLDHFFAVTALERAVVHGDMTPESIPDAPAGDGLAAKMARHQVGMDLMRVGVTFDKADLWLRGARVLTDAPLDPSELGESGVINPKVIGHAETLRRLAGSAAARPPAERLDVDRQLLATCVGCHTE